MKSIKLGEPVLESGQSFANEIEVGDHAKVMLLGPEGMAGETERVWVKVTKVIEKVHAASKYEGVIDNVVECFEHVKLGDVIQFEDRNVFAVMAQDAQIGTVN